MSAGTSIEWTDATWNPVRGCSRVSEGCRNCYAERTAARFCGKGQPYEGLAIQRAGSKWTGEVRLVPERLADPLRWRKPRRVFVNSMSDLFHEKLDETEIDAVFAVMLLAPHHTFQVLTKRPERMRSYLSDIDVYERVVLAADQFRRKRPKLTGIGISNPTTMPAPWVWLGVSVEDQATADERIPFLLETPAAVRFVSYEPALGPVSITKYLDPGCDCEFQATESGSRRGHHEKCSSNSHLDWVIAGSESGPGARPAELKWFRSIRDQSAAAGVPYFFKQWVDPPTSGYQLGRRKISLPVLDGRRHVEWPR